MLNIADSITSKITPNLQKFVFLRAILEQGKMIIEVEVKNENSLYYIKKYARSASGCFIRIGKSSHNMSEEQIEKEYIRSLRIAKNIND